MSLRRHFPPDSPWPRNTIARERVHPDVDWLINRLAMLSAEPTQRKLAVKQAQHIWSCVTDVRVDRLHEQRRRRLTGTRHAPGPLLELRRLQHAARTADKNANWPSWWLAWAAASSATLKTVWSPEIPPVEQALDEHGRAGTRRGPIADAVTEIRADDGLHAIAPWPADALPRINAAIRQHRALERQINPHEATLTVAIRWAFFVMTNVEKPWRSRRAYAELRTLGRDIDEHFMLGLYLRDGPQLRALLDVSDEPVPPRFAQVVVLPALN
jgi:hypothetical protein